MTSYSVCKIVDRRPITAGDAPAAPPKPTRARASHPTYEMMITEAILSMKEKDGSTRQTVEAHLELNFAVCNKKAFARAIKVGVVKGCFVQPKGPNGKLKFAGSVIAHTEALAKWQTKPAAPKKKKTKAALPSTGYECLVEWCPRGKAATVTESSWEPESELQATAPEKLDNYFLSLRKPGEDRLFIVIARVSTGTSQEIITSLETQKRFGAELHAKKYSHLRLVFRESTESAFERIPEIVQDTFQYAWSGDVVFAYDPDRLSRCRKNGNLTVQTYIERGVNVVTRIGDICLFPTPGCIDYQAQGALFRGIELGWDESNKKGKRARDNHVPYGMVVAPDGTRIPDVEAQRILADFADLDRARIAAGATRTTPSYVEAVTSLCTHLNYVGRVKVCKSKQTKWTPAMVHTMLDSVTA